MKSIFYIIIIFYSIHMHAEILPKSKWKHIMKKQLPQFMCHEISYFRKCFNVSSLECLNYSQKTSESCISKMQMKKTINVEIEGVDYAKSFGRCVGLSYEENYKDKKSSSKECSQIYNWN